jgi:hypothetical protein
MYYGYMNYPSQRALVAATSYGLVRKLVQMYDAKTVDHKEKETPLLLSQKAAICAFGAAAALYAWPYYVYVDASRLEIAMRKMKPEDHGYLNKFYWAQYFLE